MILRISFAAIALFWVVMNVLLWRSEFGFAGEQGSKVPVSLVWEKILAAPDDSSLSINFDGRRLGYLRLRPNVEGANAGKIASENEPEGIVRRVSEYTLDLEGSFVAEAITRSIRFTGTIAFDTDLRWKRFRTQTFVRPYTWEWSGNAQEKAFWFQSKDGDTEWIRRFTLDELRDPKALLSQVESPLLANLLPQITSSFSATNSTPGFAINWEARYEWLTIGRNKVRIYRLEARLLDRHRVVLLVSRVGEILRVEFPGGLKLINDVLYAT